MRRNGRRLDSNKKTNLTIEEQKQNRRKNRKPQVKPGGSLFSKLVCVLLGCVIGLVATVGGVAGFGYLALTQYTVKDAFGVVNSVAGLDLKYTDYVTEEYGDKTSLELLLSVGNVAKDFATGKGTLNSLDSISPFVGKNVQKVVDKINAYGIPLDYNTAMSTPINALGPYLNDTLDNAELEPLLGVSHSSDAIMRALVYGNLHTHYEFADKDEDGTIDGITMLPKRYFIDGTTITDLDEHTITGTLGAPDASGIYELTIPQPTEDDPENALVQYLRSATPKEGYYVYANKEDSQAQENKIPNEKTKLADLRGGDATYIERIELHTIFQNDGGSYGTLLNYILFNDVNADPNSPNYKPRTLGNFTKHSQDIINGLSVQKLLGKDIYHKVALGAPDAAGIAQPLEGGTEQLCVPVYNNDFALVGYKPVTQHSFTLTDSGTLKETTYFVYTDALGNVASSPLQGCWKYLLVNRSLTFDDALIQDKLTEMGLPYDPATIKQVKELGVEQEANIQDLGTLTNTIATNMQKATLVELYTDKLLSMDESILKEDILYSKEVGGVLIDIVPAGTYGTKTKLGQLTVKEAISYISSLMGFLKAH